MMSGADETTDDLADDVVGELDRLGLADDPEAEGDGRVDVAAGDRADGVGGHQQAEPEGQGHAEDPDRALAGRSGRWPGWPCPGHRR